MCGLVGVVVKATNGFTRATEDSFYQMLYTGALRGDDSTGVVFVENDSSFGIMKEAYASAYLTTELRTSVKGKSMFARGKAMLGHNRKATVGAVEDSTAHPFVVDNNFALIHNGTLRNHKDLADTVVDSEALAVHLSKVLIDTPVTEDLNIAFGKVNGAYAVAAFNQEANKLFLTRNAERPLSYIDTPEGFFFASEMGMLLWICSRNLTSLGNAEAKHLKANELLIYDLATNKVTLMEYVPKKAIPITATTVVIGTRQTKIGGATTDKSVSKSQFKYLRNHWIGQPLEFYADDYVEADFPNTIGKGSHEVNLMGESDAFTCSHMIIGSFDLHELTPGNTSFMDCLYRGVVSDMSYNKTTGSITFILGNLHKVPTPVLSIAYENKSLVH